MNTTIHVASGVGTGPTELAAYDAALADINLHNYNLVAVSSVIPKTATVVQADRAPDLGAAGNRLFVVQSEMASRPGTDEPIVAGLGWVTGDGPGLFYEANGHDEAVVQQLLEDGLQAGGELREWTFTDQSFEVRLVEPGTDKYTVVVCLAAYGDSEPMFK